MHINDEIKAIAEAIKDAVPAEQIYLFGSYAYGQPHENSDYDFFVVVPDNMRVIDAVHHSYRAVPRPLNKPIDILANTVSRFHERKTWIATIEKNVAQKGVLLYDKRSRSMAS
ncbi:MAG: nucleotidyltransferase domain-containing protein [Oscillospiraceae bacterium]|nr:nucleotidyltransferase domain-containing protein [Oscillospiraceae bacterium]